MINYGTNLNRGWTRNYDSVSAENAEITRLRQKRDALEMEKEQLQKRLAELQQRTQAPDCDHVTNTDLGHKRSVFDLLNRGRQRRLSDVAVETMVTLRPSPREIMFINLVSSCRKSGNEK